MNLEELKKENEILKQTIINLEAKLKKYTNSGSHKDYYEQHKDEVKAKGKSYIEKLKVEDPEKLKAYWKKAYEKRKLKIAQAL